MHRLLLLALVALVLPTSACTVRTGRNHSSLSGHPANQNHEHCHDRGGKHHKTVCHSHPHGPGHH